MTDSWLGNKGCEYPKDAFKVGVGGSKSYMHILIKLTDDIK